MIDLLALFSWNPGFRGILVVVVAVTILCGSVFLLLATNSGARLGFLLALTGFCGWLFVMGIIWSIYGIGYKGPAPTWKVVDTVRTEPCTASLDPPKDCDFTVQSKIPVVESVPLPAQMPDPLALRNGSKTLTEAYPTSQRDPSLGDLVTVADDAFQKNHEKNPQLFDTINKKADPWRILESSNKYTGETQAVVAEALGPDDQKVFTAATDYQVIESFLTGGRKPRTDDSILARATHKVTQTFEIKPKDFYAVVQLQQVIPQETKAGQAPPAPVRDQNKEVISVVLKRVKGHQLRIPQMTMTFLMGVATAILCNMLHRRDKLAQAQRAAAGAA